MGNRILDKEEQIIYSPMNRRLPKYFTMDLTLREGLIMAYQNMIHLQGNYIDRRVDGNEERRDLFKKATLLIDSQFNQSDAQVINLMNWYSTNLMSYLSLCAMVQFVNTKNVSFSDVHSQNDLKCEYREHKTAYLKGVPGAQVIKKYRDKVGAHPAFSAPDKDYISDVIQSVSIKPTYSNKKLLFTPTIYESGGESRLSSWSVVDSFNSIRERFIEC